MYLYLHLYVYKGSIVCVHVGVRISVGVLYLSYVCKRVFHVCKRVFVSLFACAFMRYVCICIFGCVRFLYLCLSV